MPTSNRNSRRDRRYPVRAGAGSVRFERPDSEEDCCALCMLSAAGLGFEIAEELGRNLPPGTILESATVHLGGLELQGDIVVKNSRELGDGKLEIGGLFLPVSVDVERVLASLIIGMDAVTSPSA